jgi:hypothetical protein
MVFSPSRILLQLLICLAVLPGSLFQLVHGLGQYLLLDYLLFGYIHDEENKNKIQCILIQNRRKVREIKIVPFNITDKLNENILKIDDN